MGVLNTTPDSFSDGGNFETLTNAKHHAQQMIGEGASIIDIGGESSRPNADVVSEKEELERVIPIMQSLQEQSLQTQAKNITLSIDTYKEEVMRQALQSGATMINDIYALQKVQNMDFLTQSNCDICLMHMQGTPQTMQNNPKYHNIIDEIKDFFTQRIEYCLKNNIDTKRIILDVGFGFGKSYNDNIILLKNLQIFKDMGSGMSFRVLVGLSKKSMFDKMLGGRSPDGRVIASTIAANIAIDNGADIIRTHNPLEVSDMLTVKAALQ